MGNLIEDEVFLISRLWAGKKEEILLIGKELIRLIISVSKVQRPEIVNIIEEISKSDYWSLLFSQSQRQGFNPYVQICIPPITEKMLIYLLTEAKRANLNKYMIWLVKRIGISGEVYIYIIKREKMSLSCQI